MMSERHRHSLVNVSESDTLNANYATERFGFCLTSVRCYVCMQLTSSHDISSFLCNRTDQNIKKLMLPEHARALRKLLVAGFCNAQNVHLHVKWCSSMQAHTLLICNINF